MQVSLAAPSLSSLRTSSIVRHGRRHESGTKGVIAIDTPPFLSLQQWCMARNTSQQASKAGRPSLTLAYRVVASTKPGLLLQNSSPLDVDLQRTSCNLEL